MYTAEFKKVLTNILPEIKHFSISRLKFLKTFIKIKLSCKPRNYYI